MAWSKKAAATVTHKGFRPENWQNFVGQHSSALDRRLRVASNKISLVQKASEILGEELSLDKYLLSHCTIVASVDTQEVPNIKLGTIDNGKGRTINRMWDNFRITPETQDLINNNSDGWDRPVLLASYPTFIGAENFLEHLQLAEHSKGKLIDAVARDTGKSIYVDILVASNKKHVQLIKDIESGTLSTLSMGCHVTHTQCTKCGNVAIDETDLCDCQKYERGNTFIDELGNIQKVAELCGNKDLDHPTKGVKFIEASWVRVPAFTGAVIRNIVSPEVVNLETQKQAQSILNQPPKEWVNSEGIAKAAGAQGSSYLYAFDFDEEGDSGEEDKATEKKEEPKEPFEELEDEVETFVTDNVRKRIQDKLKQKNQESAAKGELGVSSNDNLMKTARFRQKYEDSINTLTKIARSDADFVNNLSIINREFGINLNKELYRTVLQVGSITKYGKKTSSYLSTCEKLMKRRVTRKEAQNLVCLGQILSKLEKDQ